MAQDPKNAAEQLERELEGLRQQYEFFFAGNRKSEPARERLAFETTIRRLGQRAFVNTQDQFRFNSLQSRYYSLANYWARTLRNLEEGRATRETVRRVPPPLPAPDPAEPVDAGHIDAAAAALAAARAECGLPVSDDPAPLREALLARAREISAGAGGKRVEFRISVEEGRPKVRAVLK